MPPTTTYMYVSYLPKVGGFLRVLRFPPPIKLTRHDMTLDVESGVKHQWINQPSIWCSWLVGGALSWMPKVCALDLYRKSNCPHHIREWIWQWPCRSCPSRLSRQLWLFHSLVLSLPKTLLAFDILSPAQRRCVHLCIWCIQRIGKPSTWFSIVPSTMISFSSQWFLPGWKSNSVFLMFFSVNRTYLKLLKMHLLSVASALVYE